MSEIRFSSANFTAEVTKLFLPEDTLRHSPNYYNISRKHSLIFFPSALTWQKEFGVFSPICKHCQGDPHVPLNCVACGLGVSPNRGCCKCIGTFLQCVLQPDLVSSTYGFLSCITSFHLQTLNVCLISFYKPCPVSFTLPVLMREIEHV